MKHADLLAKTEQYVRNALDQAESGHNWWHIERVRRNARILRAQEGGDRDVVELAALLHDIADHKFHGGDEEVGPATAKRWLLQNGSEEALASAVADVIRNINYKGPQGAERALSLEHAVVQDADRLDALGAIGIARTFAFGGYFKRQFFEPEKLPDLAMGAQQYRQSGNSTINHFFEKLLLLRERMLTETGRELALERHARMIEFLQQFFEEWFGGETIPPAWEQLLKRYSVPT